MSIIARRAGHPIDWTLVDIPMFLNLRLAAVVGNYEPLAAYLRDRLVLKQGG